MHLRLLRVVSNAFSSVDIPLRRVIYIPEGTLSIIERSISNTRILEPEVWGIGH